MHIEQTVSWTAIVAIVVFSLTQLLTLSYKILETRRERRHLTRALCAELKQIVKQSGEASSREIFNDFVDKCSIEILNAYAIPLYKAPLFEANLRNLPLLPSNLVSEIVNAYGLMFRMKGLIEHFKSKEFLSAPDYVHNSMKKILKQTNFDFIDCAENLFEKLKKFHR